MTDKKANALALKMNHKDIVKKAMENIEDELVSEQVSMIRDYVKGAYWFRRELENEVKAIEEKINKINDAIKSSETGDMDAMKAIKIPAKFLSEKTVRINDLDWDTEEK